jgi:hypothetical protein
MSQNRLMTMEEQSVVALKAFELKDQGKLEEYERVRKLIPLQPYFAKFVKDHNDFTVVESVLYKAAETTYPTVPKYCYKGFLCNTVHPACTARRTRLQNSLLTSGINMIEKQSLLCEQLI